MTLHAHSLSGSPRPRTAAASAVMLALTGLCTAGLGQQPCGAGHADWECRLPDHGAPGEGLYVNNLWPRGVVPYEFDLSPTSPGYVSPANQQKAIAAMATIEAVCNVDFVPRTGETDYVRIRNDTTSYSDWIGRKGGMQIVGILPWDAHYIIVHELIHALGAWHENQREDRDKYITTNTQNIPQNQLNNFVIKPGVVFEWYDFDSVMHYRRFHFTGNGYPTIDVKPGFERWRYRIGQVTHLSTGDIWLLRQMYNGPTPTQPPGVFDLTAPALAAAVGSGWSPSFSWSAAAGAATYRILVDDDRLFGSPEIDQTVAATTFAGGSLGNNAVYYWTVEAQNATGITTPWHTPVGSFFTGSLVPATLYVDDSAPAGGDGASWATALADLQSAIALAECAGGAPVEIRVGQGVYTPDRGGGDRHASFVLRSNLTLRGGYAGHGAPDPDARDTSAHPAILSGDLSGDDGPGFVNYSDNSIHVLWAAGQRTGPVSLDGFTITGGNADGGFIPIGQGGGLWADDCEIELKDCTFTACRATVDGGGAFLQACDAAIEGCEFTGNLSAPIVFGRGGGLSVDNGWGVIGVEGCTFSGNQALRGGGVFVRFSEAGIGGTVVENNGALHGGGAMVLSADAGFRACRFLGNSATGGYGGGLLAGASSGVSLVNALVSGNTAGTAGGGVEGEFGAALTLVNCTITANSGPGGGGLYLLAGGPTSASVSNSILHANTGGQIVLAAGTTATVNHCNVQGGWSGPGGSNMALDPLFVAPGAGNYALGPGSPCIDAAANSAVPAGVTTDLAGSPRFIDDPCTTDPGLGPAPVVDMGAYEYRFYPDCTLDGVLTVADFGCFQTQFVIGTSYADCNADGALTVSDFGCFQTKFVVGCP